MTQPNFQLWLDYLGGFLMEKNIYSHNILKILKNIFHSVDVIAFYARVKHSDPDFWDLTKEDLFLGLDKAVEEDSSIPKELLSTMASAEKKNFLAQVDHAAKLLNCMPYSKMVDTLKAEHDLKAIQLPTYNLVPSLR